MAGSGVFYDLYLSLSPLSLEKAVSFLSLHHPQGSARLGSPKDQQKWTDGHFEVIRGPRLESEPSQVHEYSLSASILYP